MVIDGIAMVNFTRERERENNHFGSEGCKFHLEFLEWASNK
jgi:hypothetical protein